MTIPKLALTFEEAAEACGYSVRTLKDQVSRGNLMARYANSKGVIRVEDLAQWLDDLPAEPKTGHRPASRLEADEKGTDTIRTLGGAEDDLGTTDPIPKPLFRTPEDVAPELGVSKSTLRGYCRASGIYTKVGKKIMLHQDDITKLVAWVRIRNAQTPEEKARDPFG